jgi:hypothetical protein
MKQPVRLLLSLLGLFLICGNLYSQHSRRDDDGRDDDDKLKVKRWEFGVNIGGYFANKYTANFYNGSESNENKLSYVMGNKYWYQEICQSLNVPDTSKVYVTGIPTNMHYHPAITGGLFLRCNITKKHGIFLEANYVKLKTEDAITLQIPPSYWTFEQFYVEPIYGQEERVMIDLAYQYTWTLKSNINFFVQAGPTMIYNRVLKNAVVIEGTEYSLINIYGNQFYVPNTNMQEVQNLQGGFGFGLYTGAGAGFPLTDYFSVEAGGFMHYASTHLEGYQELRPSFGIYLRILFHNLF